MISCDKDSNKSPIDRSFEWKHTATGDASLIDEDPMLKSFKFMNVRTGEVKTIVTYNLEAAERRISSEG